MLAQQPASERVEQSDLRCIPLHLNAPSDPARRRAVVSGFDFDTAIQVHRALAVLVITKRFEWQRKQRRAFFGEYYGYLALGSAVNTRVGPPLFPPVEMSLRFF